MASKDSSKSNITLNNAGSKIANYILNTPLQTLANKFMYVGLLISFLVIGYLFGKLEILEGNPTTVAQNAATAQATAENQGAAQAPPTLSAEEVLAVLNTGHLPPDGNENAPVTIVEFSDFECPFCNSFYKDTLPQIREEYIDTGKVKIYYRHLPLAFHPQAKPLAIASECANDQGKFWEMHDKIFDNHDLIGSSSVEDFKTWAQEIGVNPTQFNTCMDNLEHKDAVDEDIAAAGEVGADGTPTFFINGQTVQGAQPFSAFKAIIDQELGN